MADKDEEWDGPVQEASTPIAERMESLEAGETPDEIVTEAVPPIEERVARLERIAEYLHDARKEAAGLATSVDTLAAATKSLTDLLVVIESQQQSIEALGRRADAGEANTEATRQRGIKRAFLAGAGLAVILAFGGALFVLQERTIERIEAESFARGIANCEASNDASNGIRDFISVLFPANDTPNERGDEIVRLAEEGFPVRDCAAELAEASETG